MGRGRLRRGGLVLVGGRSLQGEEGRGDGPDRGESENLQEAIGGADETSQRQRLADPRALSGSRYIGCTAVSST